MVNSIKKIITTQELDVSCWVKTRNSLSSKSTFLLWAGSLYAFVPNEKKKHLFKIVGMSVSRCLPNEDNSWDFTSRELTYYLDPDTEQIIHQWQNPWTGETLPVVHVANNPVQGLFKGNFPAKVNGNNTTFVFDLFTNYPNPLAGDSRFIEYSPEPNYQAGELFKLTVPTAELLDPKVLEVSQVILSWDRIGPWLPWMKMGNKPGQLIYSTQGLKLNSFSDLPEWLQEEINNHIPLYKDAPTKILESENITSWKYFKEHFSDYLAGARFPLPIAQ
ncbi:MAG: DUF1838 domain-containing protein [Xenococcaceae cyanobacterium MO_167.B27]|nr:DUF1838 domain-containing protein [Xenococcaceae cyanobacterium MO_167.B27]